jgi:hypothetical protein
MRLWRPLWPAAAALLPAPARMLPRRAAAATRCPTMRLHAGWQNMNASWQYILRSCPLLEIHACSAPGAGARSCALHGAQEDARRRFRPIEKLPDNPDWGPGDVLEVTLGEPAVVAQLDRSSMLEGGLPGLARVWKVRLHCVMHACCIYAWPWPMVSSNGPALPWASPTADLD